MFKPSRILVTDDMGDFYRVREIVEPQNFNVVRPWRDMAATKTGFKEITDNGKIKVSTVVHEMWAERLPAVGDLFPQIAFLWDENHGHGSPYEISGMLYTFAERLPGDDPSGPNSGIFFEFLVKEARSLDKMIAVR